jgi:hypothetical protein
LVPDFRKDKHYLDKPAKSRGIQDVLAELAEIEKILEGRFLDRD